MKKLTTEEFIEKARRVHGSKYDYSKSEYALSHIKVCIICPIHGEFWQTPNDHTNGQGCPCCYRESIRTGNYGVGVLDKDLKEPKGKCDRAWRRMLRRGHSENFKEKSRSYEGISVCEEWWVFSNFEKWWNNHYVEGWHLDKDILVKGNKVYSPQTCCFVPPQINTLFTQRTRDRGKYPIGVSMVRGRIRANVNCYGKNVSLGAFDTPEEAFIAYKEAKEAHIKEIADKWKEQIEPRVYEAMYNWKVEITD